MVWQYYSFPTNATSATSLLQYANSVSCGFISECSNLYALMILLLVFGVSFMAVSSFSKERAFAFASVVSFITAVMLYTLSMLHVNFVLLTVFAMAVSYYLLHKSQVV